MLQHIFALALLAAPPAIPDTPAGKTLQAWLDAFNSGDRKRMEAYAQKHDPAHPDCSPPPLPRGLR